MTYSRQVSSTFRLSSKARERLVDLNRASDALLNDSNTRREQTPTATYAEELRKLNAPGGNLT